MYKVNLCVVAMLVLIEGIYGLNCAREQGKVDCCDGYIWNISSQKCIKCMAGFSGKNCAFRCPFPSYGEECQSICKCNKSVCDISTGCPITTEKFTRATHPASNYPATTGSNSADTNHLTTTDGNSCTLLQTIYNVNSNLPLTIGIYLFVFLIILVFGFYIVRKVLNIKRRHDVIRQETSKTENYQDIMTTGSERNNYESLLAGNVYEGCTNVCISYQRENKCFKIQLEYDQSAIENPNLEYEEKQNNEYDDCLHVENRKEITAREYEEPCVNRGSQEVPISV